MHSILKSFSLFVDGKVAVCFTMVFDWETMVNDLTIILYNLLQIKDRGLNQLY